MKSGAQICCGDEQPNLICRKPQWVILCSNRNGVQADIFLERSRPRSTCPIMPIRLILRRKLIRRK